jgi:hypothetical protein
LGRAGAADELDRTDNHGPGGQPNRESALLPAGPPQNCGLLSPQGTTVTCRLSGCPGGASSKAPGGDPGPSLSHSHGRPLSQGRLLRSSWMLACATAIPRGGGHPGRGRCPAVCTTVAFVDGRGSHLAGGGTPLGGAAARAASGSRFWCRRRGSRARRWRPPPGWWPSRRRAAARTAAAVPRSAGPGPGRAKSPPRQPIELTFERESGMLPTATGRAPGHRGDRKRLWSRRSALVRRAADGQQPTAVAINLTLREA